jgi:hypothetical protein
VNTTELIESVKRRASFPTSQNLFTPESILDILNEEMQTSILPMLLRIQEDFYLTYEEFPVSEKELPIPSKAIGQKIRSLGIYLDGELSQNIPRADIETQQMNPRVGFIFENYKIKLLNSISYSSNAVIRMYYYKKPATLELESQVSSIISVDPITNLVTLQNIPIWLSVGARIDVTSSQNPFSQVLEGAEVIDVLGNTIELDSVENIAVGDVLARPGKTFFPNAPEEVHKLLAQRAAVKTLESQGKPTEMAAAQGIYREMEGNILYLLTPRSDGTTKKFIPEHGISSFVR